jgi:hypothetical protein
MSNTQARDHTPAHNAPLHYVAVLLLLLCVTESFSERRVDLLRRAVRSLLFKPELPAVLLENGEGCKVCVCVRARSCSCWQQVLYVCQTTHHTRAHVHVSIMHMHCSHQPLSAAN